MGHDSSVTPHSPYPNRRLAPHRDSIVRSFDRRRRCRCSRTIRPQRRRRHHHQHHRVLVLVSSANHRYLATMDALDLSTRAISAANHRHRRRRSNERTIESRCGHAPPPVRVRGVRGRRRVMTLPGVPETPERWEGLRTPRREGSGAPRARARRVETRRDGRRRRGAVARDGGDGVGRRTPDAGDASVR